MSQPGLGSPSTFRLPKRRFSVYSMMLIVSFIALVTACVLLHVEVKKYGPAPQWNTGGLNVPGGR